MLFAQPYQKCITPECLGCKRIQVARWYKTGGLIRVCSTYARPEMWWKRGYCPFKPPYVKPKIKGVRVGQQKQRKGR